MRKRQRVVLGTAWSCGICQDGRLFENERAIDVHLWAAHGIEPPREGDREVHSCVCIGCSASRKDHPDWPLTLSENGYLSRQGPHRFKLVGVDDPGIA